MEDQNVQEPIDTEGMFVFGDEDEAIPEQLIAVGTETEIRIIGTPSIKSGQGQPSEYYPNGYRYAMLKITAEAEDFPSSPLIDATIMFPSPDDKPRDQNRKAGVFQQFKQALGWTPPAGLNPYDEDGFEFPDLKDATVTAKIGQKFNKGMGKVDNIVSAWIVEGEDV
jgi:hypothetical protein